MLYIVCQMSAENKVQIGVRVPESMKTALEQRAEERHLDVADIAREAFREYMDRHPMKQPVLPLVTEKKEEVAA